jgi:hypothetical protein
MWRPAYLSILALVLGAGCAADRRPDEFTPDGLMRVPSRSSGGVYRAQDASFVHYKRIILEPPSISFTKSWPEQHKDVSAAELARMRAESVALFREEFARVFVERGPYQFAEDPAADVLLVVPAIEDLDIAAPEVARGETTRSWTTGPVSMKVTGDLRDALTGKLVARVITYQLPEGYGLHEFREANRVTNAHEQRVVFARWSRLTREALDVAKAAKPRPPATAAPR